MTYVILKVTKKQGFTLSLEGTRAFNLLTCGFDIVTCVVDLVIRELELVTRRFKLVTCTSRNS